MLTDVERRNDGFRLLAKQYGRQLYWHIRRIVVAHEDAEDALQETYINIWNALDHFRGDAPLIAWVYRIATNEALRVLRRKTRLWQSVDDLAPMLTEQLCAQAESGTDAEVLFQQALLTLPTQQRIAFNLRYYDELSYDDIARITGKKPTAVKANYHYAKEKITRYLNEHAL